MQLLFAVVNFMRRLIEMEILRKTFLNVRMDCEPSNVARELVSGFIFQTHAYVSYVAFYVSIFTNKTFLIYVKLFILIKRNVIVCATETK